MATADRNIAPTFDKKGNPQYTSITSPPDESFAICYMVPDRIIPVIFVPGVMGSNLSDVDNRSVWLLDSEEGMLVDWGGTGPKKRKLLLNPAKTKVYRKGKIPKGTSQSNEELLRRGWGEVGASSYAEWLVWLENTLNDYDDPRSGERVHLIDQMLEGAVKMDKVSRDEIALTYKYRMPVHAVGYNWLDSNATSAQRLKQKIAEYVNFYKKNQFKCDKVIIVTHSMGGLVARYCSEVLGMKDQILGIVHGVMPAIGAAAVYRRLKAGTEDVTGWYSVSGWLASKVLGENAAEMTAVLSSAPGPLQLLPGVEYGMQWLKFHDGKSVLDKESLPKADPYSEIYTVRGKWWSLCDDQLMNPLDEKKATLEADWTAFTRLVSEKVKVFHEELSGKYHPHTYAFCGLDVANKAYGHVQWTYSQSASNPYSTLADTMMDAPFHRGRGAGLAHPLRLAAKPGPFNPDPKPFITTMQVSEPDEDGDGTVPRRSGLAVKDHCKAFFQLPRVGHEPAYKNENHHAQRAALFGIVKIAQRIKHVAGMAYP